MLTHSKHSPSSWRGQKKNKTNGSIRVIIFLDEHPCWSWISLYAFAAESEGSLPCKCWHWPGPPSCLSRSIQLLPVSCHTSLSLEKTPRISAQSPSLFFRGFFFFLPFSLLPSLLSPKNLPVCELYCRSTVSMFLCQTCCWHLLEYAGRGRRPVTCHLLRASLQLAQMTEEIAQGLHTAGPSQLPLRHPEGHHGTAPVGLLPALPNPPPPTNEPHANWIWPV